MLSEDQVRQPPQNNQASGSEKSARRQNGARRSSAVCQEDEDRAWVKTNLRLRNGEPMLDIANVLRVLERHDAFAGRFRYNNDLNKVMDRGSVMLDWRVAEVVAVIQERFLPEISEVAVQKGLLVYANRVIQK